MADTQTRARLSHRPMMFQARAQAVDLEPCIVLDMVVFFCARRLGSFNNDFGKCQCINQALLCFALARGSNQPSLFFFKGDPFSFCVHRAHRQLRFPRGTCYLALLGSQHRDTRAPSCAQDWPVKSSDRPFRKCMGVWRVWTQEAEQQDISSCRFADLLRGCFANEYSCCRGAMLCVVRIENDAFLHHVVYWVTSSVVIEDGLVRINGMWTVLSTWAEQH